MRSLTRGNGWMPRTRRRGILLLAAAILGACTPSPSVPPPTDPHSATPAPREVSLPPVPSQSEASFSITNAPLGMPVPQALPTPLPPIVTPSAEPWGTWSSVGLPAIVAMPSITIHATWDEHYGYAQGVSYLLESADGGFGGKGQVPVYLPGATGSRGGSLTAW